MSNPKHPRVVRVRAQFAVHHGLDPKINYTVDIAEVTSSATIMALTAPDGTLAARVNQLHLGNEFREVRQVKAVLDTLVKSYAPEPAPQILY